MEQLSGDHQALAIDAVGGDSSQGSDQKDGNLAGEANSPSFKADPVNLYISHDWLRSASRCR